MSNELTALVNDLQGNMEVIGEFLSDPISVLRKYNVQEKEQEIVLSRDVEQLSALLISQSLVIGMLSGAHTQQCTCHHNPQC